MCGGQCMHYFVFFNDTATTEIYTLSLHDALPICRPFRGQAPVQFQVVRRNEPSAQPPDRKSTRLNSSHMSISYAVFCLKKQTMMGSIVSRNDWQVLSAGPLWCTHMWLKVSVVYRSAAFCRATCVSFGPYFFFLMIRRPPRSALFPYPTLFR